MEASMRVSTHGGGPGCVLLAGSVYAATSVGLVGDNLDLLAFLAERVGSQPPPVFAWR